MKEVAVAGMRRRFKQTKPLKDRLASFGKDLRDTASGLKAGAEKDALLTRARLADTAAHLSYRVQLAGPEATARAAPTKARSDRLVSSEAIDDAQQIATPRGA